MNQPGMAAMHGYQPTAHERRYLIIGPGWGGRLDRRRTKLTDVTSREMDRSATSSVGDDRVGLRRVGCRVPIALRGVPGAGAPLGWILVGRGDDRSSRVGRHVDLAGERGQRGHVGGGWRFVPAIWLAGALRAMGRDLVDARPTERCSRATADPSAQGIKRARTFRRARSWGDVSATGPRRRFRPSRRR
jgi:hypothetical protein